ncbi:MAG: efflux RND transporter permease subunit, partial [Bdellovibrionales bacterium]|nr:efflux RND transporter permease subunit [Bdellovibrionales bacterium]
MKRFFGFFARYHLLANILMLAITLLGLRALSTLPRDVYPFVDLGQQVIVTHYPGASPEDVELKVTNRIEAELKTVGSIERFTSVSAENISIITVHIGADKSDGRLAEIKQEVRDAVRSISDLPGELEALPHVADIDVSTIPILEIGIIGDVPYSVLQANARRLERVLEDVAGVKFIERFGWQAREIQVEVSPDKLYDYRVPLQEIVASIKARNIRGTGGSFESFTSDKNIVTLAQFSAPEEAGDVVVRGGFDGPLIRISDLAVIHDSFKEPRDFGRINGEKGILLQLFKESDADVIRVAGEIQRTLEERTELLDAGIRVVSSKDASRLVKSRVEMVTSNGLMGFFLVFCILALTLSAGTALWVSLSLPIVLLGVVALLPVFGLGIDTLMLTSMVLVLGIIVDDSIIVSESIYRQYEKGKSPVNAAIDGLDEVFFPVLTTMLTTVMAFAPMFFMSGIMGKFIFVMPLTICLTLFVSLVESTLILPSHLAFSLEGTREGKPGGKEVRLMRYVEFYYSGFLMRVLRLRYFLMLLFLALLAGSLWLGFHYLGFELFSKSAADGFYVKVEAPPGTSLKRTEELIAELENIIAEIPADELDSYVTHGGRKTHDKEAPLTGDNVAVVIVVLSPFQERSRTAAEIVDSVRVKAKALEAHMTIVYEIANDGPPVGRPITINIVGVDDVKRAEAAEQIEAYLQSNVGVSDVARSDRQGKEELRVVLDYGKLARLGLTAADVAQTIRLAYDGEEVTSVRYGEDDVGFRVLLEQKARAQPIVFHDIAVPNRQGRLVKLSQVASFAQGPGPLEVQHYNGLRATTVTADTAGSVSPEAVVRQLFDKLQLVTRYPDLQFKIGGEAKEAAESMRAQVFALGLALLGIYLMLSVFFNSLIQPLVVLIAVPFGIVGVI